MGWLYILLSCLCFGITNCIWSVTQKGTNYLTTVINRSLFTVLIFSIVLLLPATHPAQAPDWKSIGLAIVISAVSSLGLLCYVYSLRFTKVSLAVPISSLNALFGVATALIVLQESFHVGLLLALALIGIALRLLQEESAWVLSKGVWLNIGAAFFWGVTFALFYIPIQTLGPWLFGFILEATVLLTAVLLFFIQGQQWSWQPLQQKLYWYVLLGLLGFGGGAFYNLATQHLPISQLSIIGVSTIFISLLLSRIWLKEKLQKREWVSIVLFALAILLLKLMY
jgi:drug/metabolite transporter (DMT)-like permease